MRWLAVLVFFFSLPALGAPARADERESLTFVQRTVKVGDFEANILLPEKPKGKLPVLLLFGGFQEAGKVLDLVHPKVPVAVASFDYPFSPPRVFRFPESLKYAPEVKRTIRVTLRRIASLVRYLKARPDIDPSRITIIGASFGAPFSILAGAELSDLRGIVLVHGFGDIPGTAMHQLLRSWLPKAGILAYPAAWLLSRLGWIYLDVPSPEELARTFRSTQKVLMITAESDSFIPRKSSDALWKSLEKSKAEVERILMPGDHLQPGSDRLIETIMARITDWIGQKGLG